MFRNLTIYRTSARVQLDESKLEAQAFVACGDLDHVSRGWVRPFDHDTLIYNLPGDHQFITLCTEEKKLPKQVIDRKTAEYVVDIEARQGFKPGRKQVKEIRERVIDELLPRAFTTRSKANVWIDHAAGFIVLDTASESRAHDVFLAMLKLTDVQLPVEGLRVNTSPRKAMTDWLVALNWSDDDGLPDDFTIDNAAELRATGEGKATVRYLNHALETKSIPEHLSSGKQVTKLAMTWNERISFVLHENLTLTAVEKLNVLADAPLDADERRDAELALMVGEYRALICGLLGELGGIAIDENVNGQ